ncbi:MAG: DUF6538 domain-containing protein, partial [Tabrizicola flagellatus]|uniref:DUF6538 domain-containing protein n=1 Tax=Tabrizicola flagellatus TaxID=2593021 RepID=UPI00391D61FA
MAENKAAPHSFVKDGVYYFIRRVPNDLRHHYTSSKISYSLRTRSVTVAASRAVRAAQKLDEYWYHLRINDSDLPGKHMLRMAGNIGVAPSTLPMPAAAAIAASVKLSEAVSIYLRLKGKGRPITFQRSAERSCGYVIDVSGDKDITAYTKADANAFVLRLPVHYAAAREDLGERCAYARSLRCDDVGIAGLAARSIVASGLAAEAADPKTVMIDVEPVVRHWSENHWRGYLKAHRTATSLR